MSASEVPADRRSSDALTPVTFEFPDNLAPHPRYVAVVGSFNGWDPKANPLSKTPDGKWTTTLYLPPCRVVYRFDVDGIAWLDPDEGAHVVGARATEYSSRRVGQEARHEGLHDPSARSDSDPTADIGPECWIDERPNAVVIRPWGRLNCSTVSVFREWLRAAVLYNRHIVVDMAGITHVDGPGVLELLVVRHYARAAGRLMVLAGLRESVGKVVAVMDPEHHLAIVPSVEMAEELLRFAA